MTSCPNCRVVSYSVEEIAEQVKGSETSQGISAFRIVFCPLHQAAQQMREALKQAEYFFQNITDVYHGPNYGLAFKAVSSALAASEGKEKP